MDTIFVLSKENLLFTVDHKAIDTIHAGLYSNFYLAINMDNYSKSMFSKKRNPWKK